MARANELIDIYCRNTGIFGVDKQAVKIGYHHLQHGSSIDDVFPTSPVMQKIRKLCARNAEKKLAYNLLDTDPGYRAHVNSIIESMNPYMDVPTRLLELIDKKERPYKAQRFCNDY